ncbi:MAG: hypothetical protein CSA81_05070 [Acidobacteria bacterium]|nr:MAG: hypothetical protein CSA81_05070 [Acidobacteriota bacterium]PIE91039.1 MAG: hypothetical protein CR997_02665 [Acidobacteriota bacterium]
MCVHPDEQTGETAKRSAYSFFYQDTTTPIGQALFAHAKEEFAVCAFKIPVQMTCLLFLLTIVRISLKQVHHRHNRDSIDIFKRTI